MRKQLSLFTLFFCIIFVPNVWGKTVSGKITMKFNMSDHDKGKNVQLWIPYPVTDEYQNISNIKITGDYSEAAVYTDRTFKTPMLYARWGNGSKSRKLNFSFDVRSSMFISPLTLLSVVHVVGSSFRLLDLWTLRLLVGFFRLLANPFHGSFNSLLPTSIKHFSLAFIH